MTHNQIEYAKYREDQRHNMATEYETNRNNVAVLAETNRHNVAYETETNRHNVINENETYRHNFATERETNRHNVVTEYNDAWRNQINQSHYERSDAETARHNRAQEGIGWGNVRASLIGAYAASQQAQAATRNAEVNAMVGLTETRKNLSQASLNEANRDYQRKKTDYEYHEVANKYINTGLKGIQTFVSIFK